MGGEARLVILQISVGASSNSGHFRVSVSCRMRPAAPVTLDGSFCEMLLSAPVVLPLSQRVCLLRQRHPQLTRAQAMRMLLNKSCGAAPPLDECDDDDGAVDVSERGIVAMQTTDTNQLNGDVGLCPPNFTT